MEKDKVQKDDEISSEELEQVNGGVSSAVDMFLKFDNKKGDSTALKRSSVFLKIK
jgi:hypothetical protein